MVEEQRPSLREPEPSASEPRRRFGLVIVVAAVVTLVDVVTKVWAVNALDDRDIDLLGSLRLHLERNSGAAFSLNQGRGGLIAVLAVGVVFGLLWFGRTATTAAGALAIGLILGGAVGNLIDRVTRDGSAVVDFIDVQWWPVFNVADIGVTLGAILLLLSSRRR